MERKKIADKKVEILIFRFHYYQCVLASFTDLEEDVVIKPLYLKKIILLIISNLYTSLFLFDEIVLENLTCLPFVTL